MFCLVSDYLACQRPRTKHRKPPRFLGVILVSRRLLSCNLCLKSLTNAGIDMYCEFLVVICLPRFLRAAKSSTAICCKTLIFCRRNRSAADFLSYFLICCYFSYFY